MNVKISVKKLFNMEQLIISLKEGNKKYIAENFSLKEGLKDAEASLNRMDDRCDAYMKSQLTLEGKNKALKKDVEILSHQLKHSRKLADNWSKECVDEIDKIKALKVLHEKEIKLLEQRNDALDEQCEALKLEVEDLKVKVAMSEEDLENLIQRCSE